MKHCHKCDKDLPLSDFPVRKPYGRHSPCKECRRKHSREWRRNRPRLRAKRVRVWYSDNYYAGQVLECFTCGEDKPSHRFNKQKGIWTKGKIRRSWCKDCRNRVKGYNKRKNYPSDSVLEPWQRQEVCRRVIQEWWDKVKSGEIPLPENMGVIDHLGGPRSNDVLPWKKDLPASYPVWE